MCVSFVAFDIGPSNGVNATIVLRGLNLLFECKKNKILMSLKRREQVENMYVWESFVDLTFGIERCQCENCTS